jgi:uncharacterized membrane protein
MNHYASVSGGIAPPKWLWPVIFVAAVGLLDASYLTYIHYSDGIVACSAHASCDDVLGSPFSSIAEIPLALFGVVFYLLTCIFAVLAARGIHLAQPMLKMLTALGFVVSCYLLYLQLSVIHAICEYCMVSFAASTLLFAITWSFFGLKNVDAFYRQKLLGLPAKF